MSAKTCNHYNIHVDDCLDCIKESQYESYFSKLHYAYPTGNDNFVDEKTDKGKFVNGNFPIALYKNPGDAVYLTIAPSKYIGKVVGLNTKKNWVSVDRGGAMYWIINDSRLTTTAAADTSKMTTAEKVALGATAVNSGTNGGVAGIGGSIVSGTTTIADDILPDWDTLKWYLIAIVVILIIFMIYKIMK